MAKHLVRHLKGPEKGKTRKIDLLEAGKAMAAGDVECADGNETNEEKAERGTYEADARKNLPGDGEDKAIAAAVTMFETMIQKKLDEHTRQINQKTTDQMGKIAKGLDSISIKRSADDDPAGGFRNLGDFASQVARHYGKGGGELSENMKGYLAFVKTKAGPDGLNEATGSQGGDLVPTEYANTVYRDVISQSIMFKNTRQYPINLGRTLEIPVRTINNPGVTAASGGSLGAWISTDGTTIIPQMPVYGRVQMQLNKWATLLPVTDELLQDNNVALGTFIVDEGTQALAWDLNQALINGTGSGQPTGILSTVIDSGVSTGTCVGVDRQTAGSVTYNDFANMRKALWTVRPGDLTSVRWLMHPDVLAKVLELEDTSGRNIFYAAGSIQQAPNLKIFGIPIEEVYQCGALGNVGDVILADMSQYFVSTKVGAAVETAMSMHLYFDSAQMAYRIMYRIDGKPARTTPISLTGSTQSRLGFVALNYTGS